MLVLVSPILLPFITAVAALGVRKHRRLQTAVAGVGATLQLGAALALFWTVWHREVPMAVGLGSWPAPIGIVVVADTLSAALVTVAAWVHWLATLYAGGCIGEGYRRSDYWPLMNTMLMGVQGAFLTGDLFNLYVWFEVLLISSFILVALGNGRRPIEAAIRYTVINLLSSAFFLTAIGLTYGMTGTLNLADLSRVWAERASPLFPAVGVLFVVGFGIKAAMVPMNFWLPYAYGRMPSFMLAPLAALLGKVGVYALLRVGVLLGLIDMPLIRGGLLVVGMLSIVIGALGAWGQSTLRGILLHTLVFAAGFMLLGLSTGTQSSLVGCIAYLLSDMAVISAVNLLAQEVEQCTGRRTLAEMGGVYAHRPLLAMAFLGVALSLCGFPPTIGFWAKVTVLSSVAAAGALVPVVVAVLASVVVLGAVVQGWSLGLWKPHPEPRDLAGCAGAGISLAVGVSWGKCVRAWVGIYLSGGCVDGSAPSGARSPQLGVVSSSGGTSMSSIQYVALLMLVWVLLFSSLDPWVWGLGGVVGWAVYRTTRALYPPLASQRGVRLRAVGGVWLMGAFLRELAASAISVAREAWRPQLAIRPGVVAVPLEAGSDLEIAVLASLISLTPGTLSLEVSADRRRLFVHALVVEGEGEAIRIRIKERLERPVKRAFYA